MKASAVNRLFSFPMVSLILVSGLVAWGCGAGDSGKVGEDLRSSAEVSEPRSGDGGGVDLIDTLDLASDQAELPDDLVIADTREPELPETLDKDTWEDLDWEQSSPDTDTAQPLDTLEPQPPLPGFGTIHGQCGVLDSEELESSQPWLILNVLDFGQDPYDSSDHDLLTDGGQEIMDVPNAGGSSQESEAFAYEVLARCELASLLKTEMEIEYNDPQGKLTDFLVEIDGLKIGVSVTRAMSWPLDAEYTGEQAESLLNKKLKGILDSSANVTPGDEWVKQILFILAWGPQQAEVVAQAWQAIEADLKADTVVIISTTDGADDFLY